MYSNLAEARDLRFGTPRLLSIAGKSNMVRDLSDLAQGVSTIASELRRCIPDVGLNRIADIKRMLWMPGLGQAQMMKRAPNLS